MHTIKCYVTQNNTYMHILKNISFVIFRESALCWGQKNTLQSDCAPANAVSSFRMPFPWQLGGDGDEESHHNICEFPIPCSSQDAMQFCVQKMTDLLDFVSQVGAGLNLVSGFLLTTVSSKHNDESIKQTKMQ